MLSIDMKPALEGRLPSTILTASADGEPNIANLSKVWAVDDAYLAVANQMLNKTARNVAENPLVLLRLPDPRDLLHWEIEARYVGAETEGALYERVRNDLQAVAWMAGADDFAALRSVFLFEVLSCRKCEEDAVDRSPEADRYEGLLQALSDVLGWKRLAYWLPPSDGQGELKLAASRGQQGSERAEAVIARLKRLSALVLAERRVVQLRHMSSQLRYAHTLLSESDKQGQTADRGDIPLPERELPSSFAGIPVFDMQQLIGVISCEETEDQPEGGSRFDEGFLHLLSRRLGESIAAAGQLNGFECLALYRQAVERAVMEWDKSNDPFHSALSARERQVSVCVANGLTNDEIAKSLFISKRTVTTHLERIYQKLEVGSRAALTRYVVEKGHLIETSDAPGEGV